MARGAEDSSVPGAPPMTMNLRTRPRGLLWSVIYRGSVIWSVRARTEDEALSIARDVTGRAEGSLSVARRLRK